MSRPKLPDSQPRFDGGLNTVSDDASLLPNQMRRAENARLTDFGAVTKRGGTRRTSTAVLSAHEVQGGFFWPDINTTFAVLNGEIWSTTYGTFPWTWSNAAGTPNLSTTAIPSFAKFYDGSAEVVYIADGGLLNKLASATTGTADIASTAQCTNIVVHNERLWGCGVTASPDSIWYSSLNDGDTLGNAGSGGGEIIVRTFADEVVVGLASVNTSLLIFHRRGISRLTGYGQDDIAVAPEGVTADVGSIAANSIVASDNVAYFISERGLYRCNESQVAPVGTPEKPDPLLPIIRTMTTAQLADIRCVLNRGTRELWVYLPGQGVFVYHTLLNAWAGPWNEGYLDPETTALFEVNDTNGLPVVLRGDEDGWVSLCDAPDIFTDNAAAAGTGGTRYAMVVQMHRMYCGDDAEAKALRWGYLTADLNGSDACAVTWATDTAYGNYEIDAAGGGRWGVGVWGTGLWLAATSRNYRIPMGGNGYYVDVSVTDSGDALPVLSRLQLETFALGRR